MCRFIVGTGYDYPDIPGLGNNNEKIGLPEKNKISKTKETAEWNCSFCKTDVHLCESIVCNGCLEWNHLKCVGLKAPPKSTYWLCRQCYNKGK